MKSLEEARNAKQIGKSLEAQVRLSAADPVYSVLARYRDQLRYVFIVSAVTLEQKASGNGTGSVSGAGQQGGRNEVRPLLELLHSRGREQGLSYGV